MAQVSFVLVDYSTCQSDEGLGGGSLIVSKRYASREVKLVGEIDVEHGGGRDDERGI